MTLEVTRWIVIAERLEENEANVSSIIQSQKLGNLSTFEKDISEGFFLKIPPTAAAQSAAVEDILIRISWYSRFGHSYENSDAGISQLLRRIPRGTLS